MMKYRPDWRPGHEYCIVCDAEAPERISSTHFRCRTCGQCRERRVFLDPQMTYWQGPDGKLWHESAGVFVRNPDGRFLFYRRAIYPAGTLTVPSGHVNAGESPQEAAVRELTEEISTDAVRFTGDQITHVGTDDINGDSCRRGSDDHRWHTFLLVLGSPIDPDGVTVSYEGSGPALLTLEQAARTGELTRPVRYVIDHHAAGLTR
jgi:ADP-ribose pyrophosphatase YjhB (NUDIX family)